MQKEPKKNTWVFISDYDDSTTTEATIKEAKTIEGTKVVYRFNQVKLRGTHFAAGFLLIY
jgi:hypothetical protein